MRALVPTSRPLLLTAFSLFAAACSLGCGAAGPKVCRSSAACESGESCVVGKCATDSAASPAPAISRRVVLDAESVAFVSSSDGAVRDASLPLGASIGPSGRILVRFPKGTWTADSVAKAYLILDRADGAQAGPGDVTVQASSITEPWSLAGGAGISWASPPTAASLTDAQAIVPPRGHAPIRIDVTPYAVELGKKASKAWGLRVEGNGGGYGVPIATGFGAGLPPRLEIYFTL